MDFYAAVNAKDVDKAMNYVADTAVFVNPNGTFRGAEEVRRNLEGSLLVTFEHSNLRAKGGRVVYDFKVKDDLSGRVIAEGADGLTIVEDGKIVVRRHRANREGPLTAVMSPVRANPKVLQDAALVRGWMAGRDCGCYSEQARSG